MCLPQVSRSKDEAQPRFLHFQGYGTGKLLYFDNAGELVGSAHNLGWMVDTPTPGEPNANDRAERGVGIIKEGIRTTFRNQDWTCRGGLMQESTPHLRRT